MDEDTPTAEGVIGVPQARVDGFPRLTGEARFTDDLKLPRMLVGRLKRSTQAHARIVRVDAGRARALRGVHAVLTGTDLPVLYGVLPATQDETALAVGKVRYIGEPVAAVAAVDEDTALAALDLIEVEYEPLPPVLDVETALRDEVLLHEDRGTNVLREVAQEHGDLEAAFRGAHLVLERTYHYGASTHVPLETHAALARWDEAGRLTLWSSTQVPHYARRILAQVLQIPERQVRVVKPFVGAAYGGKSEVFSLEICAAALARDTGRPVKITWTREEVFYAHRGRHPVSFRLKSAHRADGGLLGLDLQAYLDTGAYASFGAVTTWYAGAFGALPYTLPAYRWRATNVYTNTPPAGPKRGHGAIQPRFALEVHLDEVADLLHLDPAEMRAAQLVQAGTTTLDGLQVTSCGLAEALARVVDASGWAHRRPALPPGRGLGVACSAYMSGAAHPIYKNDLSHSTVEVRVDRSGLVTVASGTAEIGQGSTTMLASVVAEVLGCALRDVRVVEGDTDLTPVDLGSYSSRVTFMGGNAARQAAEALRARLLAAAARTLGVPAEAIRARPEGFSIPGGAAMPWPQVASLAEASGGPLLAVGTYRPPRGSGTFGGRGAGPSPAYSFTATVAEVEVDAETGQVHVLKLWCAHDCGRALNPTAVLGQIEGSVYMGLGEALFEELGYRPRAGLMIAPSLLEYALPTILDTPPIEAFIVESLDPGGPFGAKEAGEGPQLGVAPAVANAVAQALGRRIRAVPMTPDRVLACIGGRGRSPRLPDVLRPDADAKVARRAALLAKRRARGRPGPSGEDTP